MHNKKTRFHVCFILDSQGILCKTVEDHDKISLVVSETLHKYVMHESHSSYGL